MLDLKAAVAASTAALGTLSHIDRIYRGLETARHLIGVAPRMEAVRVPPCC